MTNGHGNDNKNMRSDIRKDKIKVQCIAIKMALFVSVIGTALDKVIMSFCVCVSMCVSFFATACEQNRLFCPTQYMRLNVAAQQLTEI